MKGVVTLAILVVGAFSASILAAMRAPSLPVIFEEPVSFALTDQDGAPFSTKDLEGRVWVACFVFTRCAGPCPVLATQMSRLQNTESPEFRYVTFSVDPDHDRPAVLRKFGEQYGADFSRWKLLTGTWPEIEKLVREQFRLTAKKEDDPQPGFEVMHDLRLVLLDRKARIRGYYIVCTSDFRPNDEELGKLKADMTKLLASGE